jgi:hypothetical protein
LLIRYTSQMLGEFFNRKSQVESAHAVCALKSNIKTILSSFVEGAAVLRIEVPEPFQD